MPYSATDPRSFGYRGVFSVAAGGNSGSTYTIHNPALAKNVMAVGGSGHTCQEFEWTELQRNILTSTDPEYEYKGPYTNLLPCSGNSRNFDANSIWDASSSGSTSYARIKPDVVAPAQLVTGNIESYVRPDRLNPFAPPPYLNAAYGTDDPGIGGYQPLSDRPFLWAYSSGTSYATPAVAGAAAVSAAYLRRALGVVEPSPALLRAYIMNHTKMLTGAETDEPGSSTAFDNIPSRRQGWGRPRMDMMLDEEANNPAARYVLDQRVALTQGASWSVTGTVPDPTKPLRVTLAWTDPPADIGDGGPIVNNLDLLVETDGELMAEGICLGPLSLSGVPAWYVGNRFDETSDTLASGYSIPTAEGDTVCTRDTANNVEAIVVPGDGVGMDGAVTIRVEAVTVALDGFKYGGILRGVRRQDFALVAYNFIPDTPKWEEMEGVEVKGAATEDPCGADDITAWSLPNFWGWKINATAGMTYTPAITNGTSIAACETVVTLAPSRGATGGEEGRWSTPYLSEPVGDRTFRDMEGTWHHAPARIYRADMAMAYEGEGTENEIELAFGTTTAVGPGLSRYLFPSLAPKPANDPGDSTRVWFIPKALVGPELPEVPGYSMAMRHGDGYAELRLYGSEIESLAREEFPVTGVLLNEGVAAPETREVAPLTATGLAAFDPDEWCLDDPCGGFCATPMAAGAAGGLLWRVSGTTSSVDRYSASYYAPFTLESGKLYVLDVWIRAEAQEHALPKLDLRLETFENCGGPWDDQIEAVTTFELATESEGGLDVGGLSRVYSHAFEVQRTEMSSFMLRLDLHDDGDPARRFDGDYIIERVILRELAIP